MVTDRPDQLGPLVSYALTKTLEDVANQISVDNDTLMRALSADMVTRGVVPIADSTMRINVRFPDSIVVRARKIPVAGQVIGVNVEGPLTLSWSINGADCGWVPLTDSTAKSVKEFRFDTPLQEGTNKIVLTVHAKPSGPGTRAELARTELPCLSLWEGRLPEVRRRWAVVIGISDYAQGGKSFRDLQFAHRDAMRFYDFLVGPRGRFASEHVLRLINADATAANVRHALFEFLAKADQDDLVLIYFSGHGVPQPGTDNFFMVCHDTDSARLASTGFPMWDIDTALRRFIRAERVVVLADACHAGAISPLAGVRTEPENPIHQYLQQLAMAEPGRLIFTASEARELSRESRQFRNGVFTHFLLKGLAEGEADADHNGVVTAGEIVEYVRHNVRSATDDKQHPNPSGQYDRQLPLSVVEKR